MAMPVPMVPAPMMATHFTGRIGVPSGTSAILPAARSPKKTWRSARCSSLRISAENPVRSAFSPSSNACFATAASTASMHLSGAG